ncbi:hypothetical protein [Flavobacterium sp. RS13.1]|uniref:hypothetical protein n=1 Tax=Flavobacterium sp. RS13.1 TaxID=3400345 RepID=UPI003AAD7B40
MKKVFLSLAVVAVLTVVSCKKADAAATEGAVDSTATEAVDSTVAPVDSTAAPVDSTAAAVDSTAAKTEVKK